MDFFHGSPEFRNPLAALVIANWFVSRQLGFLSCHISFAIFAILVSVLCVSDTTVNYCCNN